jgi:hypothetical protein
MKTMLAALAFLALSGPVLAAEGGISDRAFFTTLGAAETLRFPARKASIKAAGQEQTFLALLDDRSADPAVRAAAARALKPYVANEDTRARVLRALTDSSEDEAVRREAARALSWALTWPDVRDELLRRGADSSTPGTVRAMCYRALYSQASVDQDTREKLVDAARNRSSKDVRLGAIWGLFGAGSDSDTRAALLSLASSDSDGDVRAEALRSLFLELQADPDVHALAVKLARDGSPHLMARYAAIMLLAASADGGDAQLLSTIAQGDGDPRARLAATTALKGPASDEVIRYFHLYRWGWRGGVWRILNDPIDEA